MPKRDTVFINYEKTVQLIKEKYRNNTIFCEAINKAMGTERTTKWVSEWKRNSNLPSPEEAVYICILLQTTPDEILLHEGKTEEETAKCQKDIALVRDLLDQQGAKKAPTETSEREFVPFYEDWEKQAENWTIDQLDNAIWKLFQIKRKREGKHGD